MESKNLVVAVDLGDSNVVVAVGSLAPNGTLNIESLVSKPSKGVEAGQIENIEDACASIRSALDEVEQELNIKIHEVYAGISGDFVHSTGHTDYVHINNSSYGIKQEDVTALYERMCSARGAKTKVVMEYIPQQFVVDNRKVVEKPIGAFGDRLSATFNFILSEADPISRLTRAMKKLGLKLLKTYPNVSIIGDAVLSTNEKDEGVVVVDMGAELTDVAIYHRKVLRYTTTIPIGGNAINQDIRTMTIPDGEIERLKQNFGSAVADRVPKNSFKEIQGRTHRDKQKVILYNLAIAIEARLTDIIGFVNKEIIESGFAGKLSFGIVLTGGMAQLRYIDQLFKSITKLDVRVAEPDEVISDETCSRITSSADTTAVGILLRAIKDGYCKVDFLPDPEPEIEEVIEEEVVETEEEIIEEEEVVTPEEKPEVVEERIPTINDILKAKKEAEERQRANAQAEHEKMMREKAEREKQAQAERETQAAKEREAQAEAEREAQAEKERQAQAERERQEEEERKAEKERQDALIRENKEKSQTRKSDFNRLLQRFGTAIQDTAEKLNTRFKNSEDDDEI